MTGVLKREPSSNQRPNLLGLRHGVRLQPVLHLQPVLQRAQKAVSIRQLTAFRLRDELAIRQSSKTHQRVRHAQPIIAPAMGQLQRLRNKFNLANPTASELHVVAALLLRLPIDLLFREPDKKSGYNVK